MRIRAVTFNILVTSTAREKGFGGPAHRRCECRNRPKYVIIEYDEFSKDAKSEEERIEEIADRVLAQNIKAFKELAK